MQKDLELTHVLLFIRAELPQGENTLRKLLSKLGMYRVMRVEERVLFSITRGKDTPREWEIMLWVVKEDYQPLANCLGKIEITPKITVNRFAPL